MSDISPRLIADYVRGEAEVEDARYVAPLRPRKTRPIASGWDWEEDPPRPDPEVQAKLRALDEHVSRARLSSQNCWVR